MIPYQLLTPLWKSRDRAWCAPLLIQSFSTEKAGENVPHPTPVVSGLRPDWYFSSTYIFNICIYNMYIVPAAREGIPGRQWASALQKRTSAIQNWASLTAIQYKSLCHTVHEPLPYRTNFLKHWFMCLNKKILEFFSTQWQNSFSEAYNYLTIVMNSAFNAT